MFLVSMDNECKRQLLFDDLSQAYRKAAVFSKSLKLFHTLISVTALQKELLD